MMAIWPSSIPNRQGGLLTNQLVNIKQVHLSATTYSIRDLWVNSALIVAVSPEPSSRPDEYSEVLYSQGSTDCSIISSLTCETILNLVKGSKFVNIRQPSMGSSSTILTIRDKWINLSAIVSVSPEPFGSSGEHSAVTFVHGCSVTTLTSSLSCAALTAYCNAG